MLLGAYLIAGGMVIIAGDRLPDVLCAGRGLG
jgi:hypothetical protein